MDHRSTIENPNPGASIEISPRCSKWPQLIANQPRGELFGRSQQAWRELSRKELGLSTDRPIVATGHQTLLWHPGILAKYFIVHTMSKAHGWATANLVVDQHAEGFGDFEIPIRRNDGSLAARKLELCRPRPRKDVPMGRHEAFTPPRPPDNLNVAIPSVQIGVNRIYEAVYSHRDAANAALQMAAAIADLMRQWVEPFPNVTATDLIATSLSRAIMREMVNDPLRCAEEYNRAVEQVPEAGITPLLIRDDYVELPLWRLRDDGRRMRAYDNDVEGTLNDFSKSKIHPPNPKSKIDLLPRALFMTALVRLGMCDLFIHGTGGAVYDRTMEIWIRNWLGIEVGSIAVATATLRLPLMSPGEEMFELDAAVAGARKLWHDPEQAVASSSSPGKTKRDLVAAIDAAPRNSTDRRLKFLAMHSRLQEFRKENLGAIEDAKTRADLAKRQAADQLIAQRRDWAFPLYPDSMLDELFRAGEAASAASR